MAAFYPEGLAASGGPTALCHAVDAVVADARAHRRTASAPWARRSPLRRLPGLVDRVGAHTYRVLGPRLPAAAFEHVDFLALDLRDAALEGLRVLLERGWSNVRDRDALNDRRLPVLSDSGGGRLAQLAGRRNREDLRCDNDPGPSCRDDSGGLHPGRAGSGCPGSNRWLVQSTIDRQAASLADAVRPEVAALPSPRPRSGRAGGCGTPTEDDRFHNPDAGLPARGAQSPPPPRPLASTGVPMAGLGGCPSRGSPIPSVRPTSSVAR